MLGRATDHGPWTKAHIAVSLVAKSPLQRELNPFIAQPGKFPGCQMHGRHATQKLNMFRSYNTSALTAMRLDENPFKC